MYPITPPPPAAARWSRRGVIAAATAAASPTSAAERLPHPVTGWTRIALALGPGVAETRLIAAMHLAMHDALNAVQPGFARFRPPGPDEPAPGPAQTAPILVMAAAAAEMLSRLHPFGAGRAESGILAARQGLPTRTAQAAEALGRAVGRNTAVWLEQVRPLGAMRIEGSNRPGHWRPTPPQPAPAEFVTHAPFFAAVTPALFGAGPPEPGSARYLADLAEVRLWGAARSPARGAEQSEAAQYWVVQDLPRSNILMAVEMLEAEPLNLHRAARAMAQIAAGMSDSHIVWALAKRRFEFWRPITAINEGGFGVMRDRAWQPYLHTPMHPEFPSGHATDCSCGAALLRASFTMPGGRFRFRSVLGPGAVDEAFDSVEAAAEECRMSRLWAGAHFRSANDDGKRLGEAVAQIALAALPAL
jgi:hypothetical protein